MSRHHSHRPIPAKRIFASLPHYPTRESDGLPYIGVMYDTREQRIAEAREAAVVGLHLARAARETGNGSAWALCMNVAAEQRRRFAGLKRSGGRVDWRGEPVQEVPHAD